ncbi:MAG: hypothetical protein M1818_001029 [Claussenomyces sp. TS43310]|nr:MAG: hypothetical protein M1818_001029 [Claussenomyces sp. TS43310]
MSSSLGPLVRLHGISISQLVPGGRGTSANAVEDERTQWDGPTLDAFVTDIIAEAVPFIDAVAPKSGAGSTWKRKGSPRHYSSSEAAVHLFERVVSGTEIGQIRGMDHSSAESKDETWFCRRSCHRNAAEKGTATWQEFIRSFKDHHPQTEEDFTPTVIGARTAISWNTGNLVIDAAGERWNNVTLKVVEMKHKIDPKPLKNRTFPVLQLAANLVGVQEFIVVSIPITDFQRSPHAQYAKDKSLVVAAYTSIERVRVLPETGEVEWIMATASDAKGVLPQ